MIRDMAIKEKKTIESVKFNQLDPQKLKDYEEYSSCKFIDCNFSKLVIYGLKFIDCEFINCDLSLLNFESTGLNNTKFTGCRIQGVEFGKCSKFLFSVEFGKCILNYSTFVKMEMKNTNFFSCVMKDVSFIDSDLTNSSFDDCDLDNATFDRVNLEKSDFTEAKNYYLDPDKNRIKNAKFSVPGVTALLAKYDIKISY